MSEQQSLKRKDNGPHNGTPPPSFFGSIFNFFGSSYTKQKKYVPVRNLLDDDSIKLQPLQPDKKRKRNADDDADDAVADDAANAVITAANADDAANAYDADKNLGEVTRKVAAEVAGEEPPITIKDDAIGENYTLVTRSGEFILAIDNNSTNDFLTDFLTDIPTMHEVAIRNMAFIMEFDETRQEVEIKILQSSNEDNHILRSIPPYLLLEYKKNIITNFLLESQKMNIQLKYPCIGYSNVPHSNGDIKSPAYHQDNIVSIVTNQNFRESLDGIISNEGKSRRVDYSFFRYKSDCVSTTIKIFYNGEWIEIRFNACPKTTIAINNILDEHSRPFLIEKDEGKTYKADRRQLNEKLSLGFGQKRSLNRIEVKFLTPTQLDKIYNLRNIVLSPPFNFFLQQPKITGEVRTLSTHLDRTILQGGRKKRTKKRRTKRRKTKRKIIRK